MPLASSPRRARLVRSASKSEWRCRDRETERAAQEALLEAADTFSPRVEDGGEGIVYIDLDGLPALERGESSQLSTVSSQPISSSPRLPVSPSVSGAELSLGRDLISAAE